MSAADCCARRSARTVTRSPSIASRKMTPRTSTRRSTTRSVTRPATRSSSTVAPASPGETRPLM